MIQTGEFQAGSGTCTSTLAEANSSWSADLAPKQAQVADWTVHRVEVLSNTTGYAGLAEVSVHVGTTLCGAFPAVISAGGEWLGVTCNGDMLLMTSGIPGTTIKIENTLNSQALSFCGIRVFGSGGGQASGAVGALVSTAVDSAGALYAANRRGTIYKREAGPFTQLWEDAAVVALSPADALWKVGRTDSKPYQLNAASGAW